MNRKPWRSLLAAALLGGILAAIVLILYQRRDPEGLLGVAAAFPPESRHRARVDSCLKAAYQKRYFTAISGFQWVRTEPNLTERQLTALQDAIGKMQSRLATAAQNGDEIAARHLLAIQNETEFVE